MITLALNQTQLAPLMLSFLISNKLNPTTSITRGLPHVRPCALSGPVLTYLAARVGRQIGLARRVPFLGHGRCATRIADRRCHEELGTLHFTRELLHEDSHGSPRDLHVRVG